MDGVRETGRNGGLRVLIAGAGLAGLEVMLALRELAGSRVQIEVLTPTRELLYWPLLVADPFGEAGDRQLPIDQLLVQADATLRLGWLASVNPTAGTGRTGASEVLGYDALVIACGGSHVEAVPGALTFPAHGAVEDYRALLDDLEAGRARRLAFALPPGAGWPLPLYELALMTAAELEDRGVSDATELTIVTPESDPLGLFGIEASEAVRLILEERGISLITQTYPVAVEPRGLAIRPGGLLAAERTVALSRLEGPGIDGIPSDANGFIPTDAYGQVVGVPGVYAAGDAVAFPLKQGGVAAQQAAGVAATIAHRAGADVTPQPIRPVLRGLLLTGRQPRYVRSELTGGYGNSSTVSVEPLWWPPAKVSSRYLAPALARLAGVPIDEPAIAAHEATVPIHVVLPADLVVGDSQAGMERTP